MLHAVFIFFPIPKIYLAKWAFPEKICTLYVEDINFEQEVLTPWNFQISRITPWIFPVFFLVPHGIERFCTHKIGNPLEFYAFLRQPLWKIPHFQKL